MSWTLIKRKFEKSGGSKNENVVIGHKRTCRKNLNPNSGDIFMRFVQLLFNSKGELFEYYKLILRVTLVYSLYVLLRVMLMVAISLVIL